MDHKTAAEILVKLSQKYDLTDQEKEAVNTAIGILAWTKLSESRRKAKKEKTSNSENIWNNLRKSTNDKRPKE